MTSIRSSKKSLYMQLKLHDLKISQTYKIYIGGTSLYILPFLIITYMYIILTVAFTTKSPISRFEYQLFSLQKVLNIFFKS